MIHLEVASIRYWGHFLLKNHLSGAVCRSPIRVLGVCCMHGCGSRHLIKARSFSKASRKGFGGICDQKILFVSCLNPHHMVGWSVTAAYLRKYYRGEPWPGKVKSYSYIATVPIPSAEDCDRMHAGPDSWRLRDGPLLIPYPTNGNPCGSSRRDSR